MPKFAVTALFTASKYLGVFEAATEQDAIDMALNSNENHASLCHQCSDELELDDTSAQEGVAHLEDDDV